MNQKLEPLNQNELLSIQARLENASKFIERFSPSDSGAPLTLAALDRAFAAWLASEPAAAEINAIINCVAIAFGQALVDKAGLQWVVATDEHGAELAVHGLPNRGDVLVYPANFVAKRWDRRESNFLEEALRRIAHDVQSAASQWPTNNA
jgi:hypothetical protein